MLKPLKNYFWKYHRNLVLDLKGFKNNEIKRDERFWGYFTELYLNERCLLTEREIYNIYDLVLRTASVEGDIAEVGVYKGGSAWLISRLKGKKKLFLFDTFAGLPEVKSGVDLHSKGDFSDSSLEGVKAYLSGCRDVHFCAGLFPESAVGSGTEESRFSFVHLDVDIYQSTLGGLRYFYPRMNPGGIILSHDYRAISCPGVKKAFDEFMPGKPEMVIELWDTQCMIVKA